MALFNLEVSQAIITKALEKAAEIGAAPLTVAVLDNGGHLVALQRQDGSSILRPDIAIGKAYGSIAIGKSSRALADDAQRRPVFVQSAIELANGKLVPAPGGVLVRNSEGQILGAVGITGDQSDVDEACAIAGIEAVGFVADAAGLA